MPYDSWWELPCRLVGLEVAMPWVVSSGGASDACGPSVVFVPISDVADVRGL